MGRLGDNLVQIAEEQLQEEIEHRIDNHKSFGIDDDDLTEENIIATRETIRSAILKGE